MDTFFFYFFSFFLGLIIGSFLNVVIFRTEKDEKLTGRSRCPKCKKQIPWHDNIPVLSFLILNGRCRFCRKAISIQYPLVEILTGLSFLAVAYFVANNILAGWLGHYTSLAGLLTLSDSLNIATSLSSLDFYLKIGELFFVWAIFSVFTAILVYDLKHMLIPNSFTFTGIVFSALYGLLADFLLLTAWLAPQNQKIILDAIAWEKKQDAANVLPINISSFLSLNSSGSYEKIIHLKSFLPAFPNFIADTLGTYTERPWEFIYSLILNTHLGSGVIVGLTAAAAFFLIVYLSQETWMGMGDVKLVFFLGLFLGIFKTIAGIFLAFEIGALVGVYLVLMGRAKMRTALPFGPFLIIGAAMSLLIT